MAADAAADEVEHDRAATRRTRRRRARRGRWPRSARRAGRSRPTIRAASESGAIAELLREGRRATRSAIGAHVPALERPQLRVARDRRLPQAREVRARRRARGAHQSRWDPAGGLAPRSRSHVAHHVMDGRSSGRCASREPAKRSIAACVDREDDPFLAREVRRDRARRHLGGLGDGDSVVAANPSRANSSRATRVIVARVRSFLRSRRPGASRSGYVPGRVQFDANLRSMAPLPQLQRSTWPRPRSPR